MLKSCIYKPIPINVICWLGSWSKNGQIGDQFHFKNRDSEEL